MEAGEFHMDGRRASFLIKTGLLVLIGLQLIVFFLCGASKTGFHVDEEWSYGFANGYELGHADPGSIDGMENEPYDHWLTGSDFQNYLTVQPGEGFSYDKVYHTQEKDLSPPLYGFLLHTVSSFFPDMFSKWFGLGLNFFLFIPCQLLFFELSRRITKSESLALLACAFWGFGVSALNMVLFIRMYMLFTLWVILALLLHVKWMESRKGSAFQLVPIMIVTFLGGLTHNYFLVFAFVLSVLTAVVLALEKRWKPLRNYVGAMFAAVLSICLFFPATIRHLIATPQGVHAINSMVASTPMNDMLPKLLTAVNTEILGIPLSISDVTSSVESTVLRILAQVISAAGLVLLIA
jgi:hypothetical protein